MRNLITAAGLSLLTVACAAETPELANPPVLRVTSPERGTMRTQLGTVEVRGTVTPSIDTGVPVKHVEVNGVAARVSEDGSFIAVIPVRPGEQLIRTLAWDEKGNEARDTRAMAAGMITSPDAVLADAIAAGISSDSFHKIGVAAGNIMAATDLTTLIVNPALDVGTEAGVPDCLYAQGDLRGFAMGHPRIDLIPYAGGLRLEADLFDVNVDTRVDYAVACIDDRTDMNVRAAKVSIAGDLDLTVENGALKVHLSNSDIGIEGLDITATSLPGAVMDLINGEAAIEFLFEHGVERFMEPLLNDKLGDFAGLDKSVAVMDKTINVHVAPGAIDFTTLGAKIRLDTSIVVAGSESGRGFIYTENGLPAMNTAAGFEVALSDDMANQVLSGFWAVGGLNMTLPVEGGSFDSASAEAMLPPMISADPADGSLRLYAGDLGVSFNFDGKPLAKAVINMVLDLKVESGPNGLTLKPGTPEIYVDVLEEVDNGTGFRDDDLEAVVTLVANHTIATLGPLLGTVPVPTLGGIGVEDLGIGGKNGYVTVTGELAE